MGILFTIKKNIIKKSIEKRKIKKPFDARYSELFQIPDDADNNFNNSYYFTAHNNNGQSLFTRLGIRNNKEVEVWFAYKDNEVFYTEKEKLFSYKNSPLSIKCIEAEKTWEISYNGLLQSVDDKKKEIKCSFNAIFEATNYIHDFFYHQNAESMAISIANEKWSKSFFKEIGKNNQVHYEQQGILKGKINLDNKSKTISINCLRDHSYGKRDWNYMNNHFWLMGIKENGESVNISMVSYPSIKCIIAGNVVKNGKTLSIISTKFNNDMINNGKGADYFIIECLLENGETWLIEGKREAAINYSFDKGNYLFTEGLGSYKINGIKARGIIEFGFNKDKTRWHKI